MSEGTAAREANSPAKWDALWAAEGETSWRGTALKEVYDRIVHLVPRGSYVLDLGGGVGQLAARLRDEKGCAVTIGDVSAGAVLTANARGLRAVVLDLEDPDWQSALAAAGEFDVLVATEVLEHLSDQAYRRLLGVAASGAFEAAFLSVPNDRLGPDEEPQHARKLCALEYLGHLRARFDHCRVEVLGPCAGIGVPNFPSDRGQPAFLLGVCGEPARKKHTLSLTLPVRDEINDIERVLASFRGVADEIVIGVDPRSKDGTIKIVKKYAEVVFYLSELLGPPDDRVKTGKGFHFAHARNQCLDRCSSDWIFMTEGHEHLKEGQDTLLHLDTVPEHFKAVYVMRTGDGQQWGFPWLTRRSGGYRYERATHNQLRLPENDPVGALPKVKTLHRRHEENATDRAVQRRAQNRVRLLDDWLSGGNPLNLYYYASELRECTPDKAIERLYEFLADPRAKDGPMRYHSRLVLAKELGRAKRYDEARAVLLAATADDWSRTEHWLFLGDICLDAGRDPAEALQFYKLAATRIDDPPFTMWWIDLSCYSYLPAIRLAMAHGEMGDAEKALEWARRVPELYPEDAPPECFDEARANIAMLEAAVEGPRAATA
jgi:tetratricopeptide (TPR) repeat protein